MGRWTERKIHCFGPGYDDTMDLAPLLAVGLKGGVELIVGDDETALRVGSGRVSVLATPVVVRLLEAAALDAIERFLPEGHASVGTHLDVTHFAATPVGVRVRADAELVAVDGRTLKFRVSARDEKEAVSEGTHERVVVELARFEERLRRKVG
jgi:fluoroacetyl-CoA thioesterase